MTTLRTSGKIDASGLLHIEVPTQLAPGNVDVTVVINADPNGNGKQHFSGIVGKLNWRGDAVAEQRRLRDE
jgi:hypothetical protein